jgi:hypothetical protein
MPTDSENVRLSGWNGSDRRKVRTTRLTLRTTASPPGTTKGPWTSVKPGISESRCSPGEYAVGIEIEVAPPRGKTLRRVRFKTPRYLPTLRYLIFCRLRPRVWCAGRRLLTVRPYDYSDWKAIEIWSRRVKLYALDRMGHLKA